MGRSNREESIELRELLAERGKVVQRISREQADLDWVNNRIEKLEKYLKDNPYAGMTMFEAVEKCLRAANREGLRNCDIQQVLSEGGFRIRPDLLSSGISAQLSLAKNPFRREGKLWYMEIDDV